jgi:multiple sugar transport system ATP-binding protein
LVAKAIELAAIEKSFGEVKVLSGIDLSIEHGEFVVFVGPSGCGKSTLLRLIAGLEEISSGELKINGTRMNDTHPSQREVAMVFQSYALYPHMSVEQNIGFSLKIAGVPVVERKQKVRQAAEILQLDELLERKPGELSGGQRQRVAIGRAIVRKPRIFLFDEPLSNLDAALRVHMRLELEKLHGELDATMVYVTHDQVEAMTLADKIVVLDDGLIQQAGSPLELYIRPANQFVGKFIGSPSMGFIPAEILADGTVSFGGASAVDLPLLENAAPGPVSLGVRPEHLKASLEMDFQLEGRVRQIEHLGAETLLYVEAPSGALLTVRIEGISTIRAGQTITLGADLDNIFLFAQDTEQGRALVDYDRRSTPTQISTTKGVN